MNIKSLIKSLNYFCFYLILFCLLPKINGNRIKSKIYKPIESKHFCFRRMNATNQIGCNTKESGNVGIVYLVNEEKDMIYVLESGEHYPYMAVITPNRFNLKDMLRFKQSSDRISGVIITDFSPENRTSELSYLSPDKSCPNQYYDLYVKDTTYGNCKKQDWNVDSDGLSSPNPKEGLMFYDWPFPIFFIKNQTNIAELKDCFNRFGGPDWPLCAVQLEAPMNAAKDSVTCIRRTALSKSSYSLSQTLFCDPLGGSNIFNTLLETSKNKTIANGSLVVLSARLDSFSMFDNISPGADSALTAVVTLLSVADTLNKLKDDIRKKTDKNLLYSLLDGEAFDYIGSSRVLYDMSAGRFPFDPNDESSPDLAQIRSQHFSHFIELSQLGSHNSQDIHKLWIHKNVNTESDTHIKQLEDILIENSKDYQNLEFNRIEEQLPLPPASLQTFLKKEPKLPGVVIANHKNSYSNKFYNSFYDDFININKSQLQIQQILANISTVISKSIYQLMTNQKNPSIKSNETLVDELLDCYLRNSVCNLFKYIFPDTFHIQSMEPLPTYVGVYRSPSPSTNSRTITHRLLSYLTGDPMNVTHSECTDLAKNDLMYSYYWTANSTEQGICIRSQAIKLDAVSPAFDNYGTDGTITDYKLYSTWTESQWKVVTARMFIMPSALQQWLTLITGVAIMLFSFIVVFFLDKNSSALFPNNDDIVGQPASLSVSC